jgi:hypothetical protein
MDSSEKSFYVQYCEILIAKYLRKYKYSEAFTSFLLETKLSSSLLDLPDSSFLNILDIDKSNNPFIFQKLCPSSATSSSSEKPLLLKMILCLSEIAEKSLLWLKISFNDYKI